jgi:hypothetical protein
MARDAIAFLDAMEFDQVDLLGFFDRQLRCSGDRP